MTRTYKGAVAIVCAMIVLLTLSRLGFSHAQIPSAEHKTCKQDADCSLLELRCRAEYYCTCRSCENIDAINKTYLEKFKYLSHCTEEQNKAQGEAGACVTKNTVTSQCQNQHCIVVIKAITH